jgi:hypothetical protein
VFNKRGQCVGIAFQVGGAHVLACLNFELSSPRGYAELALQDQCTFPSLHCTMLCAVGQDADIGLTHTHINALTLCDYINMSAGPIRQRC